ncbi:hypothetical protein ACFW04_014678 [Cataglyphis niger]
MNGFRWSILYDTYQRFCKNYYGFKYLEPSLTITQFLRNGSFVITDCSRQNKSVKSAPWIISSETRRAVRILGRRYALTPTFYKYLEIGINVGAMSYVQLILGDNRGNQIVLSFKSGNR